MKQRTTTKKLPLKNTNKTGNSVQINVKREKQKWSRFQNERGSVSGDGG